MMHTSPPLAFLGISHTPLMGLNSIPADIEAELQAALVAARAQVEKFAPELIVLLGPDHYNGFFHELMPTLCVGTQASGVGDYLTPAGPLNIDEAAALSLAEWLMDEDFDPAVSRRMRVDHGFTQALQMIWGGLDTPPIVPVFMNAVAMPSVMRLRRCRSLGQALGRFAAAQSRRTLFIGSGGLSHEPPVPTLQHPDAAVRERITVRSEMTPEQREAKTRRVMAAGLALAAGEAGHKPLNPAWDQCWLDAMEEGNTRGALDRLVSQSEQSIGQEAGMSAHESKTWLGARSALPADRKLQCPLRYYRAIPEYIAGFGLMFMHT